MVTEPRIWTPGQPLTIPRLDEHMGHVGYVITELVDERTGRVHHRGRYNLITTAHRGLVASWLAGLAPASPDYIAVGTGADTQYSETNQDASADLTSSGADQRLAQGFQLTTARSVNAVLLRLLRIGTSGGNLFVDIYSDSGGNPNTLLATSDPVTINGLGTSYDWARFVFGTPASLSGATQYHIVLRSTGYTYSSGVTEVNLGIDTSSPGYANGMLRTYNGTSWSAYSPGSDAAFRVTVDPAVSFTAIVDETTRKQLTSKSLQGSSTARLLTNFTTAQANGRHGMVGLLNASSGGTLSAVAAIDLVKLNTQNLNIYWLINVN